jgi:hypothetical protein
MLDDVIAELRAARDDTRSRAIAEWAESKDRTKLKILAIVYRSAADPLLQRLALEADAFARNDPRVMTEMPTEDEIHLTDAVNTYILGDRVRAADYLNRALRHNPALKQDPMIADFSAVLMRITPEQAVKLLSAPGSESAFNIPKGARWWKLQAMRADNIRTSTEVRNLILLALLSGLMMTALWWIFTEQWAARMRVGSVGPGFILPGTDIAMLAQFAGSAFGALAVLFIVTGIVSVIDVLARSYVWHFISGAFVEGGRPPFLLILHHVVAFHVAFYVLSLGALCVLLLLSADSLSSLAQNRMAEEITGLNSRVYVWAVTCIVAYLVLMVRILMDTYRLELGNALILLMIGFIIMIVLSLGVGFVVGSPMPAIPGIFG